jgi:hypothetical protein
MRVGLIIISIVSFVLGGWYLYQMTIEENYVEASGVLESKELVKVLKENSEPIVERLDLYVILTGHKQPYLFRTYDQSESKRIYNRISTGDNLQLVIYSETNQVWGVTVNNVMILSHTRSQTLQQEKVWFMYAMGIVCAVIAAFMPKIRANKAVKHDGLQPPLT